MKIILNSKLTISACVVIALAAFANQAIAQDDYQLTPQAVTVTLVDHAVIPSVKDINPDTGLPDGRLPLVTEASWTTYDRNGNPVSDNHLTGATAKTQKLGNAEILASLVPDVIPSVRGYSLFLSDGEIIACNARTGDWQSTGYTWGANLVPLSYSSSDITNYNADGTVKTVTHRATALQEGKVTLSGDSFEGDASGVAISSFTDFSWLTDKTDPSSIQSISVPAGVKVTGIIGIATWGDVIDGSITVAASKAVKVVNPISNRF